MCESPGTLREHAPPRCLFPESKDLEDGKDLRKNLITVPSCVAHNPRLSMDDEYFFIIVASILEGNERQGQQFDTKVLRALRRRPAFARTAFSTARPATVEGQSVVSFTVDRTRIERVVEKTARGIYHHHTRGQKLLGTLRVILPMLRNPDGSLLAGVAELGQGLQAVQIPWLGDNPEVFCYRIHIHPTNGGSFVQMSFYEGFAAFVAWGGRFAERSAG